MFEIFTKKYRERIKKLEKQIEYMNFEWNKEKKLYDEETKKRFYKQKVNWVIGGIDLKEHRSIHRPMYGLNEEDARIIAEMTKEKIIKKGFGGHTSFHWRESEQCYVIDVEINA